jgi:hypothetical protein
LPRHFIVMKLNCPCSIRFHLLCGRRTVADLDDRAGGVGQSLQLGLP